MDETPRQRRVTDTSTADARLIVSTTLARFAAWRSDLASLAVRADRTLTDGDRAEMLARCSAIAVELMAARTSLLDDLAAVPAKVSGHSRVVDVQKALDGLAEQTAELQKRLG